MGQKVLSAAIAIVSAWLSSVPVIARDEQVKVDGRGVTPHLYMKQVTSNVVSPTSHNITVEVMRIDFFGQNSSSDKRSKRIRFTATYSFVDGSSNTRKTKEKNFQADVNYTGEVDDESTRRWLGSIDNPAERDLLFLGLKDFRVDER